MVKHIKYWEVGDYFGVYGVGPLSYRVMGCFSTHQVANQISKGNGKSGRDARVKGKHIIIMDSIEDFELAKIEGKKAMALSKLTEEEKELLGLK